MNQTKQTEQKAKAKKAEIVRLFQKADVEFANGVNELGNAQLSTISTANQNATDLFNQANRICKKSLERIDQQGFDTLMLEYERMTRGGK